MKEIKAQQYSIHRMGEEAELAACEYLQQQGLKLLEKNYEKETGEIDLIMQEGQYRVFVEVRQRTNPDYTSALESVTKAKQKKIIRTALFYLQGKKLVDKIPCRFDVVGVDFVFGKTQFEWVRDAFQG
jgi:putative endonuclease